MSYQSPAEIYQKEREKNEIEAGKLSGKQSRLGWLRLAIILVTIILAFRFFNYNLLAGWAVVILGIAIFLWVVSIDADNNRKLKNIKRLLFINEEEIKILEGNYDHRYDGADLLPSNHAYANDLDVFGKYSIYQFIQRCNSEQGRKLLAGNLLHAMPSSAVKERHEAVKELGSMYQWMQQLQAYSLQTPVLAATQLRTEAWLSKPGQYFKSKGWKWFVPLYSFITLGSTLLCILDYIPGALFTFIFFVYFVFAGSLSKRAMQAYTYLTGIVSELETLYGLVQWIEGKDFKSPLLRNLQDSVKVDGAGAATQINALKNILNRFDLRLNVFVFIFL
ncbi:MAG TPA: hypothetical protein VM935_09210, partial [Chitinophagaceae bacterium]|nr:hypothetical protein [Chitinophagaceae bacterium]